jgi:hypothetical protein
LPREIDLTTAECRVKFIFRFLHRFIWFFLLALPCFAVAGELYPLFPYPTDSPEGRLLQVAAAAAILDLGLIFVLIVASWTTRTAYRARAAEEGISFDGEPAIAWSEIRTVRERGVSAPSLEEADEFWVWFRRIFQGALGGLDLSYSRGCRRIPLHASGYEWMRVFILRRIPDRVRLHSRSQQPP